MIQEIYLPKAKPTTKNVNDVPPKQWKKWSNESKELFNHIMERGKIREITATDLFGTDRRVKKVLNATVWNLAWEAADFISINCKQDTQSIVKRN